MVLFTFISILTFAYFLPMLGHNNLLFCVVILNLDFYVSRRQLYPSFLVDLLSVVVQLRLLVSFRFSFGIGIVLFLIRLV